MWQWQEHMGHSLTMWTWQGDGGLLNAHIITKLPSAHEEGWSKMSKNLSTWFMNDPISTQRGSLIYFMYHVKVLPFSYAHIAKSLYQCILYVFLGLNRALAFVLIDCSCMYFCLSKKRPIETIINNVVVD